MAVKSALFDRASSRFGRTALNLVSHSPQLDSWTDGERRAGSVWVFLYGGLMNPEVMARVGLRPDRQALAELEGYQVRISPLVNLVPERHSTVYGLLAEVGHEALASAYGRLAARYHPVPVLARQSDGSLRPALCFVVPEMPEGPAEAAHVRPLLESARAFGFPDWYLSRIASFMPGEEGGGAEARDGIPTWL